MPLVPRLLGSARWLGLALAFEVLSRLPSRRAQAWAASWCLSLDMSPHRLW